MKIRVFTCGRILNPEERLHEDHILRDFPTQVIMHLTTYLSEPISDENANVVQYWANYKSRLPLNAMVEKYTINRVETFNNQLLITEKKKKI